MPDRRSINENRRDLFGAGDRVVAFVCECAAADCQSSVMLTAPQAEEAWRLHGWILASGHDPIEDDERKAAGTGGSVLPFPLDDR